MSFSLLKLEKQHFLARTHIEYFHLIFLWPLGYTYLIKKYGCHTHYPGIFFSISVLSGYRVAVFERLLSKVPYALMQGLWSYGGGFVILNTVLYCWLICNLIKMKGLLGIIVYSEKASRPPFHSADKSHFLACCV